jgi:NMD protein affecting ribosome stability and mRNA decay
MVTIIRRLICFDCGINCDLYETEHEHGVRNIMCKDCIREQEKDSDED